MGYQSLGIPKSRYGTSVIVSMTTRDKKSNKQSELIHYLPSNKALSIGSMTKSNNQMVVFNFFQWHIIFQYSQRTGCQPNMLSLWAT